MPMGYSCGALRTAETVSRPWMIVWDRDVIVIWSTPVVG
jgi:hypothetical protein